ncbi:hypothetical protein IMG5_134950 [Ichthyophthirius multifiliis]|uniref:Uncharacterized protein n=1 Tax=Ichthyophthirius multifiliis TaxID=5932 RepID=G0QWT2_ICHMU|nr:hypothetical protein IMG5_134950 [Ichthyophthirius multifiliis]EGR30321.1 hypothetical protein IMG5_134950 [Ichthyophthirius multifiliis]|eukprot:XP_004031908.1 hypothetical protein IMG5_134950 [Ichthyophthirius multifiliis]
MENKNNETIDLMELSLRKLINEQILEFNQASYGMLVSLATKYIQSDELIWKKLLNNACRLFTKAEYSQEGIINDKKNEKQQSNLVFLFNNVLKYAEKFQNHQGIKQLGDIAASHLVQKYDLIKNTNQKFLFMSNNLKIVPFKQQMWTLKYIKENQKNIQELSVETLTNLISGLQKMRVQNLKNEKFGNDVLSSDLLNSIEQEWIKKFQDQISLFVVYFYCLGSLGHIQGQSRDFCIGLPLRAQKNLSIQYTHKVFKDGTLVSIKQITNIVDGFKCKGDSK